MTRYAKFGIVASVAAALPVGDAEAGVGLVGGNGCNPDITLEQAVQDAPPGATLLLEPGLTYPANLGTITKNLTIATGDAACGQVSVRDASIDGGGGRVATISSGATVTFQNVWVGNGAAADGGVLSVDSDATLVLDGAHVENGSATFSDGGCIKVQFARLDVVGASEIKDCDAADDGGAIYAVDSTVNIVDTVTIRDSTAGDQGGGIAAVNGTLLQLGGSVTVTDNTAVDGGGVAVDGANLHMHSAATLLLNTATSGGGLYVDGSSGDAVVTIEGTATVSSNDASNAGGGLYVSGGGLGSVGVVVRGEASVDGNTAADGAGVRVGGADALVSLLGDAEISGNTSSDDGGGVYAEGGGAFRTTGGRIDGNTAEDDGGGIFQADNGVVELDNALVKDNVATYGNGGGLYVTSGMLANVEGDPSSCDESALGPNQYCSTFRNNRADFGGGAFVAGSLDARYTAFLNNDADNASAVFVDTTGSVALREARVTGNTDVPGGAALLGLGNLVLYQVTVSDNAADGVRYGAGSSGLVLNSILWGNAGADVDTGIGLNVGCTDVGTVSGGGSVFGLGSNVSLDPLFDASFHPTNPAVRNQCNNITPFDQDHDVRPVVAGSVDMGCFEQ